MNYIPYKKLANTQNELRCTIDYVLCDCLMRSQNTEVTLEDGRYYYHPERYIRMVPDEKDPLVWYTMVDLPYAITLRVSPCIKVHNRQWVKWPTLANALVEVVTWIAHWRVHWSFDELVAMHRAGNITTVTTEIADRIQEATQN